MKETKTLGGRPSAGRKPRVAGAPATQLNRNVWIGGGALILPGATIGDDAVIGAGSVVTRYVVDGQTVVGNPARPRSTR